MYSERAVMIQLGIEPRDKNQEAMVLVSWFLYLLTRFLSFLPGYLTQLLQIDNLP
jgi:hypothetical protein